ncbi:glycosyltransferase family 2 protein [Henriciella aquimarina]|uniref:glycosyltransferase family 2 protein n=1 Tax=Henriciella aquimarina TaxID=545261 RepID=UPI001301FE37|nr:glycosyltransferase family 2 protein [Henriciella aquimarina]
MSAPFSASVIIVNYNGGDFIQSALDHLKSQTLRPAEVIVIDNASSDGSADRLDLEGLDNARLLRMDDNLGFAQANNIAAREAKGDWLILLNPDGEPRPTWLAKLADAAERYPDVTSFASAQIDAENPKRLDGTGDCYSVYGFPWRGGFGAAREALPEEGECFSPCGASAMIRKDTFLQAGGFDESYFCYCEDVDLGYRLRLMGERCIFVPDAIIGHHGSAITGRLSDFTVRLGTRNRLTTYLKNTPPVLLVLSLPAHIVLTLYLYLSALGRPRARSIRRGLGEAFGRFGETMKARRDIQRQRQLSSFAIVRAMNWDPIVLHRRRPHVWPALEQTKTDKSLAS